MLDTKNKLAYVDHRYHFKTRIGDFLRDVFKSKFSIKDFWIEKKLRFTEEPNYKYLCSLMNNILLL